MVVNQPADVPSIPRRLFEVTFDPNILHISLVTYNHAFANRHMHDSCWFGFPLHCFNPSCYWSIILSSVFALLLVSLTMLLVVSYA